MKISWTLSSPLLIGAVKSFTLVPPQRSNRLGRLVAPRFLSERSVAEGDDDTSRNLAKRRDRLLERLDDIASIQETLLSANSTSTIDRLEKALEIVEKDVSQLGGRLIPPSGLSYDEYAQAIVGFLRLPMRSRWALCISLGLEDPFDVANRLDRVPEIVAKLYSERSSLTPARLKDGLDQTLYAQLKAIEGEDDPLIKAMAGSKASSLMSGSAKPKGETIKNIFGDDESVEQVVERRAEALLARVTRKEGRVATEENLKTLMKFLDKDIFMVTGKDKIKGGYVLRGSTRAKTGDDLVRRIDERLPAQFPAQVCYMDEFTMLENHDRDPVLLLVNKDMSPATSGWILSFTSAAAVFTAFLFSYTVYGGNDVVMSRVTDPVNLGDPSGITWFNDRVAEILLPLATIQLSHELGHFIVSQKDGIKTSIPTLMPCWGLPFLGATTSIRESPKNLKSLFDFALLGPLFGIITSMCFFVSGLQISNMATPDVTKYFPALPVSFIKLSTLGGSIIDFFAGGEGFITSMDSSSSVPLHPFAIAGFVGLLMNSLELLPLGATDGGRLALSIFGRKGHTLVSGLTWFVLILASLFVERADAILGAWIVYSITQNDPEIPCRDEVTKVDPLRAVIAFGMWFFAALVIIPI